jgi:hypothetical protein
MSRSSNNLLLPCHSSLLSPRVGLISSLLCKFWNPSFALDPPYDEKEYHSKPSSLTGGSNAPFYPKKETVFSDLFLLDLWCHFSRRFSSLVSFVCRFCDARGRRGRQRAGLELTCLHVALGGMKNGKRPPRIRIFPATFGIVSRPHVPYLFIKPSNPFLSSPMPRVSSEHVESRFRDTLLSCLYHSKVGHSRIAADEATGARAGLSWQDLYGSCVGLISL